MTSNDWNASDLMEWHEMSQAIRDIQGRLLILETAMQARVDSPLDLVPPVILAELSDIKTRLDDLEASVGEVTTDGGEVECVPVSGNSGFERVEERRMQREPWDLPEQTAWQEQAAWERFQTRWNNLPERFQEHD
jgi:hypothetical protein